MPSLLLLLLVGWLKSANQGPCGAAPCSLWGFFCRNQGPADFAEITESLFAMCDTHPWIVGNFGPRGCRACFKVAKQVASARRDDLNRGRGESTMTIDYVNGMQGKACMYCQIPVWTRAKPRQHDQLSPNRVDSTKAHDCDPMQTRPCCWPCNWFQGNRTVSETITAFLDLHSKINPRQPQCVDNYVRRVRSMPRNMRISFNVLMGKASRVANANNITWSP